MTMSSPHRRQLEWCLIRCDQPMKLRFSQSVFAVEMADSRRCIPCSCARIAFWIANWSNSRDICPMPTTSLPILEQRLVTCLLELEKTHGARPGLPTAIARAEAGQRVDKLYEQMVKLQEQIDASPTETLQDAAVKLRRLSAYVEDTRPMRLLSDALEAVEKAASVA